MKFKLVFGLAFLLASSLVLVNCQEDATEDEVDDDEGAVEDDDNADQAAATKDLDDEEDLDELKPSENAEVTFLWTRPSGTKARKIKDKENGKKESHYVTNAQRDLPAGAIVKFLVGFYNKGEKDFTVDTLEASFRYPQDYNFYINNYTAAQFAREVQAGHESTFDYAFMPSDTFAGRPLGLVVNLRYTDSDGVQYQNAVFNATVNIVEDESAFNPETYFLYLVFAAVLVLLLLLGRDYLAKLRRKHGVSKKQQPAIEVGTSKNDIDFEWIPKDTLNVHNNKSPGRSPRNRRPQRRTAGDD